MLEKQINHKIINTYMKRDEEKKIVMTVSSTLGDIHSLIQNSNKGIFETETDYMQIYQKLMNHPEVYLSDKALETLSEVDLRTYTFIRVVGNIDTVFMNGSYKQEDYIRVKKQEIENKVKEDLIEYIKKWNTK